MRLDSDVISQAPAEIKQVYSKNANPSMKHSQKRISVSDQLQLMNKLVSDGASKKLTMTGQEPQVFSTPNLSPQRK